LAWMRMMGVESVAYHRETVMDRADDYPGLALGYYASRGETPLSWGGSGAHALGVAGAVTDVQYDHVFGPGGFRDPTTGTRLVTTRRSGVELVVSAHKSVAVLGVVGFADEMHAILDAETDATLGVLDEWVRTVGGRRGRGQVRTPTEGLVWARTRHATSRAGDPEPHDHVLIANVVEMLDVRGGRKALDTAAIRDLLHGATMVGRLAGARTAVELGFGIEPDEGPSGKLGHWRIAGIPREACELFSKRSAEIDASMDARGLDSYQARQVAARDTRRAKRHQPVAALMPVWHAELEAVGLPVHDLERAVMRAAVERNLTRRLSDTEVERLASQALGREGRLAELKVFTRSDVIVTLAPGPDGVLVTSEHGVIEVVDPERERLTLRMADDRVVGLDAADAGADRLDYGYAVTVHRSQGDTTGRAHRYADGGGRELGYVSMSRATDRSTVHVVADDLEQAQLDLTQDWTVERRQRWAIDTGTPTTRAAEIEDQPAVPDRLRAVIREARLRSERDALVDAIPPDVATELANSQRRLAWLRQQRHDLERGTGGEFYTPEGRAGFLLSPWSRASPTPTTGPTTIVCPVPNGEPPDEKQRN
jgi:conjugative relaxase-like TrwC/TraI family protein